MKTKAAKAGAAGAGAAALIAGAMFVNSLGSGVGYVPANPVSSYSVNVGTGTPHSRTYAMDLSADPYAKDGFPSDAEEWALWERRYGPGSGTTRFTWTRGPNNEVRFIAHDALVWRYGGEPNEREVTDVQATGELWKSYMQSELDGFSEARAIAISDPTRPAGLLVSQHFFWKLPYYEMNTPPAPSDDEPEPEPEPIPDPTPDPDPDPLPVPGDCPPAPPSCSPLAGNMRRWLTNDANLTKKQRANVRVWIASCP